VQSFIESNDLKFVTIGERELNLATQAYAEFGKGRHPVALNMGDCFAYACAKANQAKLLFKGEDFTKTDISLEQSSTWHMLTTYPREATAVPPSNPAPRHVRLFRNNRNQAIRIPVEFELPGSEAIISRDGDRLIIEPVRRKGLAALLDSWEPLAEEFPEVNDPPPTAKDIF
jgi:antitoxin VapB